MKSKLFAVLALAVFCVSCGGGDDDFTCTARNDEVAAEIRTTQGQLTELRTADGRSWEWLALVPWFGRYARIERLEFTLKNLQDEGFMRGIACGELLSRRSDLGLISVPRLNGAMLLIVERNGVMNVNARRAIGDASSELRRAGHQLTDSLTALANEYEDRTLAYQNPEASPPVSIGETTWPSTRDVFALLGILTLLLLALRLVGRPILRLATRLSGNTRDQLVGRHASSSRRRLSKARRRLDDELFDEEDP